MYYSLVKPLTNKTIFYRVDVINDGFLVTCNYRSKSIEAYYNNYDNILVNIDNIDASSIIDTSEYNFNDINQVFTMIDNIIYKKQMWLKILYLMKYINKFTNQDVSYIKSYLY
jgi:hypothetical protein